MMVKELRQLRHCTYFNYSFIKIVITGHSCPLAIKLLFNYSTVPTLVIFSSSANAPLPFEVTLTGSTSGVPSVFRWLSVRIN